MNTKSKIIIICLATLMTIGIVTAILLPTTKKIVQLNNDIYNQRIALEKLYLRGQSIKKSREDYNKIKDQIKILDNIFNYQGQELKFITSLEEIANTQNIKQIIDIKNNEENEETPAGDYQIVEVKLTLQGTFADIISYLDQIQTLDYYFNIKYLNLYYSGPESFGEKSLSTLQDKKFKKSDSSPQINAIISGLTYWK